MSSSHMGLFCLQRSFVTTTSASRSCSSRDSRFDAKASATHATGLFQLAHLHLYLLTGCW